MEGGRGGLATGWRNLAVTRSQFKMICVLSQRWAHCIHFPQLQRCFFQGKLNIVITREFLTQLMCWAAARNHRCCNLEKSHRIMFSLQGKPYIHNNKIYPGNLSNEQVNIWISFFFCSKGNQNCKTATVPWSCNLIYLNSFRRRMKQSGRWRCRRGSAWWSAQCFPYWQQLPPCSGFGRLECSPAVRRTWIRREVASLDGFSTPLTVSPPPPSPRPTGPAPSPSVQT